MPKEIYRNDKTNRKTNRKSSIKILGGRIMDRLRVLAAYFIKESDMTKAAKLQLMNFLENEATDAQVMALMLDGEVQKLDEMAEQIVYDRWDAAMLDEEIKLTIPKKK
jgi:hypothetical protein